VGDVLVRVELRDHRLRLVLVVAVQVVGRQREEESERYVPHLVVVRLTATHTHTWCFSALPQEDAAARESGKHTFRFPDSRAAASS